MNAAEIKKILLTIEKRSDYRFLFTEDAVKGKPKVSVDVVEATVNEVLDKILANTGIAYKILNTNLVVLKEGATSTEITETEIRITGRVLSSTGEAVAGASITVKGTRAGTTTDNAGNFSLQVPDDAVLVISSVGFETQEISVAGKSSVSISLQPSAKKIDEVIVVGYGSQRKLDVTGSVAQLKGDEISKQASFSPISALQGKIAGVQITNGGAPGSAPEIKIRGVGTVYGSTTPLYIVDGVWYDDISFLNNNDIDNISVLKDASSGSIYGIRAANGVVLITTKKGRRGDGKPVISYNGSVGNQVVTNPIKMATGPQYQTIINELNLFSGNPMPYKNPTNVGNTDWYGQVLRNALVTNHQISVAGGSEKSSYNLSLGYVKQDGIVETNSYNRYNLHLQNDFQLAKFLRVGSVINGSVSHSDDINGGIFHQLYAAAPNVPVFYADGAYGDPNDFGVGSSNQFNPQATIDFYDNKTRNYKINGSVYADAKFARYFTFHSSIAGIFDQRETGNYAPQYIATISQRNTVSRLTSRRDEDRNWIFENTLTYDRKFNDHSFKILAGQGAQGYRNYWLNGTIQNVPAGKQYQYFSLGLANSASLTDGGAITHVSSYFGRVNYSFKNTYMLTASVRADGTSKYEKNIWGYFPSVGLGWVISNESFMKSQQIFNSLKLRGSWGKLGNMTVPASLSTLRVTQNGGFVYVGGNGSTSTGASINTVVPPVTYWERSVGADIALEATMLKNRLYAEIGWYDKKTEEAIFDIPILGSIGTGSSTIIGNQATFQNRGFEFLVSWKDNINKDWSYSISANAGINDNKVLEVSTGSNPIEQAVGTTGGARNTRTILGQPIGQFFGYKVLGIFQNGAEIANYKSHGGAGSVIQPAAQAGDFKYQDVNDDGVIDGKDRVVLGNPNPKVLYGINTNVAYKNIDLTVDLQGVQGVEVYNANLGYRFGSENFTQDFYENRWHGEGTSTVYPSANIGGGTNYLSNSFYVEDGSYFRIRNIQLGYTFTQNWVKKSGISRLRVFANAQNAFNFFKYRGFSPEIGGSPTRAGVDINVYPLYATYNFGINLTF